jgi:hypothetical protein
VQRRRVAAAGFRPEVECGGLVDVGALDGDAAEDVNGGQYRAISPSELTLCCLQIG